MTPGAHASDDVWTADGDMFTRLHALSLRVYNVYRHKLKPLHIRGSSPYAPYAFRS
jgi:hypothetical protein